jgi:hypothetical protein
MIFAASLVAASLVGAVVVGVGDVDGDATVVGVADGALRARCTVNHGRGMVPKGAVVDDDRVVLAVADDKGGRGGRGARVVLLDLRTCAERELFDEAIANQAPRVVTDAAGHTVVYAVREIDPQPEGARFEIVKADVDAAPAGPVVVTARDALWVSIAQGAQRERDLVFLVGEGAHSGAEPDGAFHVDVVDAAANLAVLHPLGRGTFKDVVVVDDAVVVEEIRGAVRGVRLFEKGAERFVPLGMAAAPYGARGHLYTSNGKKDGGILASGVALPAARVGIARPVAVDVDAVVVDVDRGALLPRELWTLPLWRSPREPARLLVPKARTAVEVYGVTSSSPPPAKRLQGVR